eukprot:10683234-Karenia_brevis.AAC.1
MPKGDDQVPFMEWWAKICHSRRMGTWRTVLEGLGAPSSEYNDLESVPDLGSLLGSNFLDHMEEMGENPLANKR